MTRHGLALALIAFIVPFASLDGGMVWYDHSLVEALPIEPGLQDWIDAITRPFSRDPAHPPQANLYYRPIVTLSYQVERMLLGDLVLGYRLTNLLSHVFCTLLVLRFVRLRVPGLGPWWAALAALPFAVHPSRVETAGFLSGRADLWMTLFALLAADASRRRGLSGVTMLLSVLAVLCKETALLLPIWLLIDAWAAPRPRDAMGQERPTRFAPALASAAGVGFAWLLRGTMVPAPSDVFAPTIAPRVLQTLGIYLGQALLPFWPQAVNAPLDAPTWTAGAPTWVASALLLGAVVAAATLRYRIPVLRGVLGDLAWLSLPLIPVLQWFPLGLPGLASLRMLYLPLVGVSALLGRALFHASGRRAQRALPLAVALWSTSLLAVALVYGRAFRSDATLWRYELSHAPDRSYALEQLGRCGLRRCGRFVAAPPACSGPVACDASAALWDAARLYRERGAHAAELRSWLALVRVAPLRTRAELDARRAFYRAVAYGGAAPVPLPLVPQPRVEVTPATARAVAADAAQVRLPWALAEMSLGHVEDAMRVLRDVPGQANAAGLAAEQRVRIEALLTLGNLAGARRMLRRAGVAAQRHEPRAWAALRATLQRAERLFDAQPPGPVREVALIFTLFAPQPAPVAASDEADRAARAQPEWWRAQIEAACGPRPQLAWQLYGYVRREHPAWLAVVPAPDTACDGRPP